MDESDSDYCKNNLIRLACMNCERDDFDGIHSLPTDWFAIEFVGDPMEEDCSRWWSHIGWCPDCKD